MFERQIYCDYQNAKTDNGRTYVREEKKLKLIAESHTNNNLGAFKLEQNINEL